jgi:long-chain acyl-CoA synthetase
MRARGTIVFSPLSKDRPGPPYTTYKLGARRNRHTVERRPRIFRQPSNDLGAEVRQAERRVSLSPDTRARTRGDVLISGATGFLGMELTARLLELGDRRVWVLVRASGQEEAAARVRSMLARLVADPDGCAERVVPVAGDLLQPGLGLDPRRRDELAEHVDEVIHAAASVSFGLPLAEARAVNVEGTRRMLELATLVSARGSGLRRFAHVSTAYVAGTHRGVFGEADLERGQGFHNSYERSKWEAELLVHSHAERLPVHVMRPSVVVGDELSGWTASFNVIYQPLRAYARGALRAVPARRSAPVDIVPVSYVARAILALADVDPGRTFTLAAGPDAPSVGELIDRAAARLGRPRPRAVPPTLYRRVVHPLLLRRARPSQRAWLERGSVLFPYFSSRVRFDASAAHAALEPLGVRAPPVADYFDRLLQFAEWAEWGRRPVGRAEAIAARSAEGSPFLVARRPTDPGRAGHPAIGSSRS